MLLQVIDLIFCSDVILIKRINENALKYFILLTSETSWNKISRYNYTVNDDSICFVVWLKSRKIERKTWIILILENA